MMDKITNDLLINEGWKRLNHCNDFVYSKNGIFLKEHETGVWLVKYLVDGTTIFYTKYYRPVQIFVDNYREDCNQNINMTNEEMTLKDLKFLKDNLEKELTERIQYFEKETGMRIEGIDLSRVGQIGSKFKQIHGVDTKINFNYE